MEGFNNQRERQEIFEKRLVQLKELWEILKEKEFNISGRIRKMDMMPFEMIEEDLRRNIPIPLVQLFGGSGLRASYDRRDGIKIWFTNSFAESNDFRQAKEEIETLWEEIKSKSL